MSYQVLLTPLKQQRFVVIELMRLARTHAASYGNVIKFAGTNWAQLTDSEVPDFFTWAQQHFFEQQLLLCFEYEQRFLVIAWNESAPQCHQLLNWLELEQWLQVLAGISDFQPVVYYWAKNTGLTKAILKYWQNAEEYGGWPVTTETIDRFPLIGGRPRRLGYSLLSLGVLIAALTWNWPQQSQPVNTPLNQVQHGIHQELTEHPGAVGPLLQLDVHLHSLLARVPGWEIQEVAYQQGVLRYSMRRKHGQLGDLRVVAEQLGLQLVSSGEHNVLLRQVALPAILPSANVSSSNFELPGLYHLQDHLDDSVRLFIAGSKLTFQPVQKFPEWQTRTLAIALENSFLDDFLTLVEIVEGLPIRILELKYRVHEGRVHGVVSLDVYGAHNG